MSERTSERQPIAFEGRPERIGDRIILRFPAEASAALPSRGQVAVAAVMNGHAFETVIEPDGMRGHWLSVDGGLLQALAGGSGEALGDGDTVTIEVEPVKQWPEPELPSDLTAALDAAPDLAEAWPSLTPMARWEWVRWIEATKNPQTRERRVEVTISKLRDGKRRPCCFDLSSCTDPEVSKSGKLVGAV
ncbi:YdeI/OmpD-associated family protein [Leucobacter sp. wl10]|uniref:YdeI/OmpD-associated family protein n=1 Tax=Leucobacter sp. wl10 TaxID=2304677 RepID=UPI000E5B7719|nr:YdeI/OmpD-associated family protein [Leucobacter sp. wl10]RGE22072.1 DUF1905 domain-containing protein [Leucobacter sp. wl10]